MIYDSTIMIQFHAKLNRSFAYLCNLFNKFSFAIFLIRYVCFVLYVYLGTLIVQ